MRIDKLLAHSGYGTRKDVKQLLKEKIVFVNDVVVTSAKLHVDTTHDVVRVEDDILTYTEQVYIMLHKPTDVLSATEDFYDTTVLDLVDEMYAKQGVFPVGRLDKDTTGLLLLTNDGKLAHQLLSPSAAVDKEYIVTLARPIEPEQITKLTAGVTLDDGYTTLPAKVITTADKMCIHLLIQEGKYHQVKRMLAAVGNHVEALHRVRMGTLLLDADLQAGEHRFLTEAELAALQAL